MIEERKGMSPEFYKKVRFTYAINFYYSSGKASM
jgi:hypothetical protein